MVNIPSFPLALMTLVLTTSTGLVTVAATTLAKKLAVKCVVRVSPMRVFLIKALLIPS
jgi:hypothetical protein